MGETENVSFILAAKDLTGAAFGSVRAGLNSLGNQVISVRGLMASLGATISVAAFTAGVKGASDAADAAAKMGDRFGIATDKLIGMQHAGELAGVSNQGLASALQGMAKSSVDAARGGVETAQAYRLL